MSSEASPPSPGKKPSRSFYKKPKLEKFDEQAFRRQQNKIAYWQAVKLVAEEIMTRAAAT